MPKSVEDVEKLQLDWKRAGLAYHRGLGPWVDFFQQVRIATGIKVCPGYRYKTVRCPNLCCRQVWGLTTDSRPQWKQHHQSHGAFALQASAPSPALSTRQGKRTRVEGQGPARAGGMSAACMGPVPTEEEAMKALGPELQVRVIDFSEVNILNWVRSVP